MDGAGSRKMGVRRVVTTHDAIGAAVVLSDDRISFPAIAGIDARGAVVWTTGSVPADNAGDVEGDRREAGATIQSGSVFRITEFGPGFESPMHRTHSIDYCAIISGQLELVLDGGETVSLRAGNIIVQRGTNHVWRNPSQEQACVVMVCMIEAQPIVFESRQLAQTL